MTPFKKTIRVYYEDTDAGGVVYHANYLNFMERCRCDWLDGLGASVNQLEQEHGVVFVIRHVDIRYDQPARLFDELTVTCDALHIGKVKLIVEQKVYHKDVLLCSATIKLATLDKTSFKLTSMPDQLIQRLTDNELN